MADMAKHHSLDDIDTCRDCGRHIRLGSEKAIGSGETQMVWVANDGRWVCVATGNEHRPKSDLPASGPYIVIEGNPVDGFVFHGIPAFEDSESASIWAENNCSREWWAAPLQDVE